MAEDGTMMRGEQLMAFAKEHDLVFITIRELQRYRRQHDQFVQEVAEAHLPTAYGDFQIHGFRNTINGEEHVALVMGDVADGNPVLCRVHSECLTGDVFGSCRCDCGEQLQKALQCIQKEGRGILVYLRQEGRGIGLLIKLRHISTGRGTGHRRSQHSVGICSRFTRLQRWCTDSERIGSNQTSPDDQ